MVSFRSCLLPIVGFAALSASAPTSDIESRAAKKCFDGPYIIVAHGTGGTGEGGFQDIIADVSEQVPNTGSTGFKYPSVTFHYPNSESTGVKHMKTHIRNYINMCGAGHKIMLLGYSQGAEIVSDIMGGGTYDQFPHQPHNRAPPLDDKYRKHVVGVLQFGDPAHTIGHSWDAGTATKNGLFPRTPDQIMHIKNYKHILQSICDKGDPYCASGKKNDHGFSVHTGYFDKYHGAAVNFLVKQWNQSQM